MKRYIGKTVLERVCSCISGKSVNDARLFITCIISAIILAAVSVSLTFAPCAFAEEVSVSEAESDSEDAKASNNGNSEGVSVDVNDADRAPAVSRISTISASDCLRISLKKGAAYVVGTSGSGDSSGTSVKFQKSSVTSSTYFNLMFIETDHSSKKGYYMIVNMNSNKAIQPANNSISSGANIVLAPRSSSNKAQHFSITKSNGYYRIVNRLSGMALHATSYPAKASTNIDQVAPSSSNAQRFYISKATNIIKAGTYKISSVSNSRKVQVRSAKTSAGSRIALAKKSNSTNQKWYFRPLSKNSNTYRIQSIQSGRYLSQSGSKIVEAKYSKSNNQKWTAAIRSNAIVLTNRATGQMLRVKNKTTLSVSSGSIVPANRFKISSVNILAAGTYFIKLNSSSKVVGVTNSPTRAGANVKLCAKTGSGSRKWTAVVNSDGTYTFRNTYSARVLAVKGGSAKRGANVYQAALSDSKSRKWKIVPALRGGFNIISALNGKSYLGSSTTASGANSKILKSGSSSRAIFTFKKATKPSSRASMERKIRNFSSSTGWLVCANTGSCFVGVYKGSKGKWTPYAYFPCSPGASSSRSKKGVYKVGQKGYAFGTDSYTCYYYTQYSGNYLFHSILYNHGTFTVQDGRMGMHISHGCIRLELVNAKWINKNIPVGSTVYVY